MAFCDKEKTPPKVGKKPIHGTGDLQVVVSVHGIACVGRLRKLFERQCEYGKTSCQTIGLGESLTNLWTQVAEGLESNVKADRKSDGDVYHKGESSRKGKKEAVVKNTTVNKKNLSKMQVRIDKKTGGGVLAKKKRCVYNFIRDERFARQLRFNPDPNGGVVCHIKHPLQFPPAAIERAIYKVIKKF